MYDGFNTIVILWNRRFSSYCGNRVTILACFDREFGNLVGFKFCQYSESTKKYITSDSSTLMNLDDMEAFFDKKKTEIREHEKVAYEKAKSRQNFISEGDVA